MNKQKKVKKTTVHKEEKTQSKTPSVLDSIINGGGSLFHSNLFQADSSSAVASSSGTSFLSTLTAGASHGSDLERARNLLCKGGEKNENQAVVLLESYVEAMSAKKGEVGVLSFLSPERMHAEARLELGKLLVGKGE